VRRDLLRETLRLFVTHLHLFTMIALTVWLPGHLVINYLDFFAGGAPGSTDAAARGIPENNSTHLTHCKCQIAGT